MPTTLPASALATMRDIATRLEQLQTELERRAVWTPMSDEEREALLDRLNHSETHELFDFALTTHKLLELNTSGRVRELLERQTWVLSALLHRLDPDGLADALARWEEAR